MKNFLRNIYSGQIHPVEDVGTHNDEVAAAEKLRDAIIAKLNQELNGRALDDFQNFLDCQDELTFLLTEDAFIRGVGFAAKFFTESIY